jgi:hypothetical protein
MSNTVTISEPSVDDLIGVWTGLELWHAESAGGTYSLLATVPYVAHQTTYTYVDTTGLLTDWYEVRRYGPGATYGSFSPTWTVTLPAPGRRSLQNARRLLAQKLHSLTLVLTTSAGNASGTSVIATRLANATDANRYRHAWVMPVDGTRVGEIRRVRAEDALNLTSGELMIAPAFSGQVASGVNVEIHRLLPPDDDDGWTGLRSCINAALREMWTSQRVSITGVGSQPSYSLSTYEEWLDADAVLELRQAALDPTTNPVVTGTFDPVRNADSLTLQISPTLPDGDASTLEVYRPLDTYIKVGGVWAASTTGLVNDSDEALFNVDLLLTVALVHAYESLANGPDGGRYEAMAKTQRTKANVAKQLHLDHRQRRIGTGLYSGYGAYDAKSFNAFRNDW